MNAWSHPTLCASPTGAEQLSEIASSPWRSGDWTVAFYGVIATRFAVRFERGPGGLGARKERFDSRLPQQKGGPKAAPHTRLELPLTRDHPHCLGSLSRLLPSAPLP